MIIPARKRISAGFTLIELLIDIAILGILEAAVLVAVNPAKRQNQAKDANIKSDVGSIATALQAYFTSPGQGTYPTTLDTLVTNQDLVQLPVPPAGGAYDYTTLDAAGGVCDATPTDPCTKAVLYEPLFAPATATYVWCWRSAAGRAAELAPPGVAGTCIP